MQSRSSPYSDFNTPQSVLLGTSVTLVAYGKVNEGYTLSEEQTIMSTTAIYLLQCAPLCKTNTIVDNFLYTIKAFWTTIRGIVDTISIISFEKQT